MTASAAIESLFTLPVAVEVATHSDFFAPIDREEAPFAAGMAERRRQEFAAGRACAHRALQRIGADGPPIPVVHRRDPIWSPGIVGSITYCEGFCAAVVARAGPIAGLGIDAEPARELDVETIGTVLNPEEQGRLADLPLPAAVWSSVGFAVKEALFKAIYRVVGREIAFEEVVIESVAWPALVARAPADPVLDQVLRRLALRATVLDQVVLAAATLLPDGKSA